MRSLALPPSNRHSTELSVRTSIIRRCNQEDDKTRINMSYEKFVESIQEGDSFTTALMEVLVKVRGET